ncbi:MAG: thioesterase family protein [Bacteroidales bacterium]
MQKRYYFKIAYADTDQMGVMYHANYFRYFEMARHDLMQDQGIEYAEVENMGVVMPVISASVEYYKPVFFGQTIEVETRVGQLQGPRIDFEASMKDSDGEIVCESKITLAFVNRESMKPCHPPEIFNRVF